MHLKSFGRAPAAWWAGLVVGLSPLFVSTAALGQGCMATRVSPPILGLRDGALPLVKGQNELSIAFRYYEAERHFYDTNDENVPANAPRVERSVLDVSWTRMLSDQGSVTVSLPIQWGVFDRSPIPPYGASADKVSGLGDLAVTYRHWLIPAGADKNYNVRLSAGLKLPTGKEDLQVNRRYNIAPPGQPANYVTGRGPADLAIQPGDGGWGVVLGAEGFYALTESTVFYGELTYLVNPRRDNGVNNQWSGAGPYVPNMTTSVPDYFLARAGVTFSEPVGWKNGTFLLGFRVEGQPVHDLVGADGGFRRPGYSLSIEPGIAYSFSRANVFLSVPTTVYRRRWLSVDEVRAGRTSAVSAAFADYNIIAGVTYRW